MTKYFVAGGAVLLLLGSFVVMQGGSGFEDKESVRNVLTPVRSFSHSHGMAVDSLDGGKVYIAAHEGLYLLQEDRDLFRVGEVRDDLMGFSAHPTESGTFWSSGHPARGGNIGFQKTVDGGFTWKTISSGLGGPVDFHAMAVSYADPDTVYGFFGGKLQRSFNGGASWEYAEGAVLPFSLSSHPTDPRVVYASTQRGVEVSNDAGNTWEDLSTELAGGAASVFTLQPSDPTHALVFSERLEGLGKSVDGGVTWQAVGERFEGGTVLFLSFSKSEPQVVYALTSKNQLYKSTDGGDTWAKVL
jgi:photosystem II stability/assembly factor-like uncharacterized protein